MFLPPVLEQHRVKKESDCHLDLLDVTGVQVLVEGSVHRHGECIGTILDSSSIVYRVLASEDVSCLQDALGIIWNRKHTAARE